MEGSQWPAITARWRATQTVSYWLVLQKPQIWTEMFKILQFHMVLTTEIEVGYKHFSNKPKIGLRYWLLVYQPVFYLLTCVTIVRWPLKFKVNILFDVELAEAFAESVDRFSKPKTSNLKSQPMQNTTSTQSNLGVCNKAATLHKQQWHKVRKNGSFHCDAKGHDYLSKWRRHTV